MSQNNIKEISDQDFEKEVIQSSNDLPVLVDFYASWCGPCKAIAPIIEAAASIYAGKVKVIKADIEKNPNIVKKYNIKGVPTIILYKNDEVVANHMGGNLSQATLKNFIDEHI